MNDPVYPCEVEILETLRQWLLVNARGKITINFTGTEQDRRRLETVEELRTCERKKLTQK